jgi:hypothetical protein
LAHHLFLVEVLGFVVLVASCFDDVVGVLDRCGLPGLCVPIGVRSFFWYMELYLLPNINFVDILLVFGMVVVGLSILLDSKLKLARVHFLREFEALKKEDRKEHNSK